MKRIIKDKNGITLIALVITIIILLILAGVTIVTLTGDNGLLQKAQISKEKNDEATNLEKVQMEVAGSYGLDGKIDISELNKNLMNIIGLTYNGKEINTDKTDVSNYNVIEKLAATVEVNGYYFKIKNNGNVKRKNPGAIEADNIIDHELEYYGKYVTNYDSPYDDGIILSNDQLGKWQIFMVDENNIYLISSNTINKYPEKKVGDDIWCYTTSENPGQTINFSNIASKYTDAVIGEVLDNLLKKDVPLEKYHKWMKNNGTNTSNNYVNKRAVASMLDIELWKPYCNDNYAEYAIGGPTLEMFCKSHNATHTDYKVKAKEEYDSGYMIQENDDEDVVYVRNIGTNNEMKKLYYNACWAASTSGRGSGSQILIDSSGTGSKYTWEGCGLRPVVCLKNDTYLVKKVEGNNVTYQIDKY